MTLAPSTQSTGLRGIVGAAILAGALILIGAGGLMLFAASRLDAIQAQREAVLVERRLERLQTRMIEDVVSASVWNDAAAAIERDDKEWMQLNFGDYYADYMDHQTTLVLDGDGRFLAASIDSEPVTEANVTALKQAAEALAAQVAAEAALPKNRAALALDAVASASALIRINGVVHQVVAASVVPEDASVSRAARDPIVVSARPISYFMQSLEADLAITSPRYEATALSGTGRFVLRGLDGAALGHVHWMPAKPGMEVMLQAVPVFVLLLLLLSGAGVALMNRLDSITRRLAASEAGLVEARDRAEAANEAKTRFLSNVSHELRTPLNGVMGMAEVLALGPLSPQQQAHLAILKASGADLLRLIEHLLAVTRLERQSEAVPEVEDFDLGELLTRAVEAHRETAEVRGLELAMTCTVRGLRTGARGALDQALAYLLENALTYTDKGSVRVDASEHGGQVLITVSDTGIGISPDVLPRLFEPFVQGDESITRRFEGAGLGLSICQGLVVSMGGRIHVDSKVGRGSRFTVSLPLPRAAVAERRERIAA
ncbi:ATP-binding protein [Brevundimonas sp. AAP58]|uniref:sensor histidine kinase n=1 Tax=Brevundimonas sp. AAP58 TaxID=1523422 RepID=UPI0006B90E3E|nr:ATP-binding protein [Brevundimonas sp. AAP58]